MPGAPVARGCSPSWNLAGFRLRQGQENEAGIDAMILTVDQGTTSTRALYVPPPTAASNCTCIC
jgi:hypothetical protein